MVHWAGVPPAVASSKNHTTPIWRHPTELTETPTNSGYSVIVPPAPQTSRVLFSQAWKGCIRTHRTSVYGSDMLSGYSGADALTGSGRGVPVQT